MRTAIYLMVFALSLGACETLQFNPAGTIAIRARVLDPRPIYHLGDSVVFYFQIPDTALIDNSPTKIVASGKDSGVIDFMGSKINTANSAGFDANTRNCLFYASPGSIVNNASFHFALVNSQLLGKMYLIPQKRGVYFLEQINDGYAIVNNGSLRLRLTFNFGNVDRHHQLLVDSAGKASHFNEYLQDHINRKLEIYGFRVD